MKNKNISVNEVPKGNENEFYSEEDSAKIKKSLSKVRHMLIPVAILSAAEIVIFLIKTFLNDLILNNLLLRYAIISVSAANAVAVVILVLLIFAEHHRLKKFLDSIENK